MEISVSDKHTLFSARLDGHRVHRGELLVYITQRRSPPTRELKAKRRITAAGTGCQRNCARW